jgi:signal peptidase I
MLTFLLFALVFGAIVASLLLGACLLSLGARWAKIPAITFRRSLAVVTAYTLLGIATNLLLAGTGWQETNSAAVVVLTLALFFFTFKIIQRGFRTTFGKAVLAWLPTIAGVGATMLLIEFAIKPYVLEGYRIPTGAMAPTIAGDHYVATCPHCGGDWFTSARPAEGHPIRPELGICSACLKTSKLTVPDRGPVPGDRIVTLKFLEPRRWDIITFRNPEDPSVHFVKRLIGLPGEEIAIRSGEIWINGERLSRPPELANLEYTSWPGSPGDPMWRDSDWGPNKLADDEYFVLGDFSRSSADSRYWKHGAPGHNPYAVPRSYLDGVVTHIYWPPSRWRLFR